MKAIIKRLFLLSCGFLCVLLCSCATSKQNTVKDLANMTDNQLYNLAEACFKQQNYDCAIKYLRPLSARGNGKATYALGYLYFYGRGIPQDKEVGRSLIRAAASYGDTNAVAALTKIMDTEGIPFHNG